MTFEEQITLLRQLKKQFLELQESIKNVRTNIEEEMKETKSDKPIHWALDDTSTALTHCEWDIDEILEDLQKGIENVYFDIKYEVNKNGRK